MPKLLCHFFTGLLLTISALSVGAQTSSEKESSTQQEVSTEASEVFGTAHPMFVQAVSPDGRWVAACQARTDSDGDGKIQVRTGQHGELWGDRVELYLFTHSNRLGERIDSLVDFDKTGRYIALKREDRLILRDDRTDSETDLSSLGADAQEDGNAALPVRGADFNKSGTQMMYLRDNQIVVRDLVTGDETLIDPGPGRLWRAEFVGVGRLIRVYSVVRDTNNNGQLDLPDQTTTLAGGNCRGQAASYSTYGFKGDQFEERMVDLTTGKTLPLEVVGWNEDVFVVRRANGALHWIGEQGDDRQIVPPSCGAKLLSVSARHGFVLVECADSKPARAIRIYDGKSQRDLPVEVDESVISRFRDGRLIAVSREHYFDRDRQKLVPVSYGGALGLHENLILQAHRGGVIRLRNLITGEETTLAGPTEKWVAGHQFGSFVVVRHESILLVDLNQQRVIGTVASMPEFVDAQGRALVMNEVSGYGSEQGPLRWVNAKPISGTN